MAEAPTMDKVGTVAAGPGTAWYSESTQVVALQVHLAQYEASSVNPRCTISVLKIMTSIDMQLNIYLAS